MRGSFPPAGILVAMHGPHGDERRASLYDRAGGATALEALVARFYAGVAEDPVLRPLYPDEDLAAAEERLAAFLVQLAGGPRRYEALRGEPQLRLRHLAFPIGERERVAWLTCMGAALEASDVPDDVAAELRSYFERTAAFLVNRGGLQLRGRGAAPASPS